MQTFCRAWSSRSTIPQLHIVGPVLTAGMVVDACAVFFSFLFLYVLLLPHLLPRVPSSGASGRDSGPARPVFLENFS